MFHRIGNFIFFTVLILIIGFRVPTWFEHFKNEDSSAPEISVINIKDQVLFQLPFKKEPHLIFFWATWCGPCSFELSRINRLIKKNKIPASRIVAISSGEKQELVQNYTQNKGYLFQVALDPDYSAAKTYRVTGTPTLVLINNDGKIDWMTMGLSPSLELRLIKALTL